jgi:hypothetical protein
MEDPFWVPNPTVTSQATTHAKKPWTMARIQINEVVNTHSRWSRRMSQVPVLLTVRRFKVNRHTHEFCSFLTKATLDAP